MSRLDRMTEILGAGIVSSDENPGLLTADGEAGGVPPAFTGCRAVDFAFDVGTSPHGLSVGLPLSDQETLDASGNPPPVKPLLTSPEVYRSPQVLESIRIIEEAASRPREVFAVTLTEAQLLHAWLQSERKLGQTLKNIARGLCVEADAHVERSLHKLLGDVVYSRLPHVAKDYAVIAGNAKGSSAWRKQMNSNFDQEDEL